MLLIKGRLGDSKFQQQNMPVLGAVCFKPEKFAKRVGICLWSLCRRSPLAGGCLLGTGTPNLNMALQGTPRQAGAGSGWGQGRCPRSRSRPKPVDEAPRRGGWPDAPHGPPAPTGDPAHPPLASIPLPSSTSIPLPSSSSPPPSCHVPGAARPSQPFVRLASILPFV